MAPILRDLAHDEPNAIGLRDTRVELTWAQINELVNRAANALDAFRTQGISRIAVLSENSVELLICHLAAAIAGLSSVPINFHLNADEVAYILQNSDTSVLFVGPEQLDTGQMAARAAGVDSIFGWRLTDTQQASSWEDWLAQSSSAEPAYDHPPRANMIYTSGTTGTPKGAELPPNNFAGGKDIREHIENLRSNPMAALGTHLVVGPMYHNGPLSSFKLLAVGVPVVILGRFDAEATLQAIDTYQVESTVMVPTHFIRILKLPEVVRARFAYSSLRSVMTTGGACPPHVFRAMIDWWGPIIFDVYGATEAGMTCTITSEEWLAHEGSVGRAAAPFTALVLDENGSSLPPGQEGRLYFVDSTGRGIVYYKDPTKTSAAHLRPGCFTIGEIAYMDAEGYVYLTDRFADMLVSGGVNIYPAEAESVLLGHPGVADVAVIGVPNEEMGEEAKALVIAVDKTAPPEVMELIQYCRARIASYKCPRSIDFVESVGRNAMGKINKRNLRDAYLASADTDEPGLRDAQHHVPEKAEG